MSVYARNCFINLPPAYAEKLLDQHIPLVFELSWTLPHRTVSLFVGWAGGFTDRTQAPNGGSAVELPASLCSCFENELGGVGSGIVGSRTQRANIRPVFDMPMATRGTPYSSSTPTHSSLLTSAVSGCVTNPHPTRSSSSSSSSRHFLSSSLLLQSWWSRRRWTTGRSLS